MLRTLVINTATASGAAIANLTPGVLRPAASTDEQQSHQPGECGAGDRAVGQDCLLDC